MFFPSFKKKKKRKYIYIFCFVTPRCVVPLKAASCVALCRNVLGLCYPEGLIKADTETGCITALMKSVSTGSTQGHLSSQCSSSTYHHTGEGEGARVGWCEVVGCNKIQRSVEI